MTQTTPRVALVTGANRGIGLGIATGLAERGLHVLVGARRLEEGQAAVSPLVERGLAATAVELDVADPSSVAAVGRAVDARFGRLDVLVNNAGSDYDTTQIPSTADLDVAQHAFMVNVLGAWRTCQLAVPLMRRAGYGRIVNVSSGSGLFSVTTAPSGPGYAVSKAGLNMLTLKLALELAGTGILVNAVCPGWVRTRMGGVAAPRSVAQGADTPIWLATLADDGPTGQFFRDRRRKDW